MVKIGIDLGGTKIEGVILDGDNEVLFRERIPTEQEQGYEHILGKVGQFYDLMVKKLNGEKHTFGIGTPGAVSPRTRLLKNSNTQCLNEMPFHRDLENLIGRKVAIQNDANCFAMAETVSGAGKGKEMVFGVIMGTGCGGGIIYKGGVITGPQAIAGEWGHMSIDMNGIQCWCGRRGCAERYISGGGLEELYKHRYGKERHFIDIMEASRAGEEPAVTFVNAFYQNFGQAMANLINILDPDIVVLGGGLSNIDELYTRGTAEVAKRVFSDSFETPIVRNQLGDSAGVIGAALIGI